MIDYKLGRQPDAESSVQLGVYAHCALQQMESRDGQSRTLQNAVYLAFGDDRKLEGRMGVTPADVAYAVSARASDFAGAVARIESGEFPPRPRQPMICQTCRYAGVCRKEFRADAEAAEVDE